jgi:predicted enzyme related to lactoylglutathione lyase
LVSDQEKGDVKMLARIWDITLTVTDLERAVAFYEKTLGLSRKYYFPDDYAGFDCGGVEIGLSTGTPTRPGKGAPCINFLVENIDETVQLLLKRGVHFVKESQETAWGGRIARFSDPDGYVMQLTQIDWHKYFTVCTRG